MFISDPYDNTIIIIENWIVNFYTGQTHKAGFRNGDIKNSEFNHPGGLVVYNETTFPKDSQFEQQYEMFLFANNSIECKYATMSNYSSCLNETFPFLNMTNSELKRNLVKFIKTNNNSNLYNESGKTVSYLFIADTYNHCIRKIDLNIGEVTTYAGKCKEMGFMDGPYGTNMFSFPQGIGIDEHGNIYVYDSGNEYMRFITPDGYVSTLVNGACFEYEMHGIIPNQFDYQNIKLLCFRKWINTQGNAIYHLPTQDTCYDVIVNCDNYTSNLTYHQNDYDK